MQKFIHQQNLELYRKLLTDPNDKDEDQRQMLLKLLSAEKGQGPTAAPQEQLRLRRSIDVGQHICG